MQEAEHHEMRLEASYPSGAEEWLCPICGRRFVLQWPPAYSMTVIVPGDEHIRHSGGKGGLRVGPPQLLAAEQASPADELDAPAVPSSYEAEELGETPLTDELRPWLRWLREAGLHRDDADAD